MTNTKHISQFVYVLQALSLPITNICFSLPFLMGDDVDSLSMCSLVGIVLVVIGFVTYSGFGLARNFMVAQVSTLMHPTQHSILVLTLCVRSSHVVFPIYIQGPPGQMTYAHFTNSKEVIVSTNISLSAVELADFMVSSIIQNLLFEEMQEKNIQQHHHTSSSSYESINTPPDEEAVLQVDISPLGATVCALQVAKDTVVLLEKQANVLRNRKLRNEYQLSKEIMR